MVGTQEIVPIAGMPTGTEASLEIVPLIKNQKSLLFTAWSPFMLLPCAWYKKYGGSSRECNGEQQEERGL